MAVSKELLAKYKEMKAKGLNVSLSELKENTNTALKSTSSSYRTEFTSQVNSNPTPNYTQPATINTKIDEYTQNYQNSFKADFSNGMQQSTIESYSQTNSEYKKPYTGNVPNLQAQTSSVQSNEIKKFALIGYPLGHSLSSYIHEAGFKSLGINAVYEILETSPENLVERIKYLKTNNYSGFNVTIPLKLPVTMFLNDADTSAKIVNAVNTVVIDPITKELKGYNTDVTGFGNAIAQDITLYGKVAGILGTGGAARAAITSLAQKQVKEIKLYTRSIPNSIEFLKYLRTTFPSIEFNAYQIERIRDLSDVNILVNATPIGMQGISADMTPVEENELKTLPQGAVVYDVIYNPKKTVLLKLAQKNGYRTINGIDMFIHQASAAEQIWTGKTPDFKDMKIAALENL